MSEVPQPDPSPRKVDTFAPEFEAACNRLFWNEALPAVPLDPTINLQSKLDMLVSAHANREVYVPDSTLLGSRSEVLAAGDPVRVRRSDKVEEIIVPFVAITGLSAPNSDPKKIWSGRPELRLGIYYSGGIDGKDNEHSKLAVFTPIPSSGSGRTDTPRGQPDDIVAALQWLKLVSKLGTIDTSILTESRRAVFDGPLRPGSFKNLQRQVGINGISDARLQELGNIDTTLAALLARDMRYNELRLVNAVSAKPPLVEVTPLVQEQIHHYEDRHILKRSLDPKFLQVASRLSKWNWQGISYRWNLSAACEKYFDVRPAAYELLARADVFREKKLDGEQTIAERLVKDLHQLSNAIQSGLFYPPRFLVSDVMFLTVNELQGQLAAAITHASNLQQGYPAGPKQLRSSYLRAVGDFRGMHSSLAKVEDSLSTLKSYSVPETDSEMLGNELDGLHFRAWKILTELNRDLRRHCPGVFKY